VRGSEIVDLLLDWLPRRWVQLGLVVVCAVMYLTHWYEPLLWCTADKVAGITELWTRFWRDYVATVMPPPSSTPSR
jgi:hypothetical protein